MTSFPMPSLIVLGSFALRVVDREVAGLPRKAQAMIALLAMQPGRRVPREVMADLLWTHRGPSRPGTACGKCWWSCAARRPGKFSDQHRVCLDRCRRTRCNALSVEAALAEDDDVALARFAAGGLGSFLEGLPPVAPGFDEWLMPERARLGGVVARALRRLTASGPPRVIWMRRCAPPLASGGDGHAG